MKRLSLNDFLTSCAFVALAAASPGFAQTSAAEITPVAVGDDVGDIVVTANKREERLNRLGLTVTAISGAALAERRITSLQDVAAAVPGLTFAQSAANTPILSLRGIGFNESSLGVYPAVSVYVDQAPLPFPVLASHAAFDLQRIEVLKGPQGTLFGQNSTGGAINYIAAKPTQEFKAGGDISYGRFNMIEGNAFISGPIAENVRARLAVSGLRADGWQISNSRPDDRNGKQSYVTGRFLLDWDPSEAIHLSFSLNGWRDTSEPQAGQFILLRGQTPADVQPQELVQPFSPEKPRAADWSTGVGTPRSNRKFYQPAFRADVELNESLTLTSLTSYAHYTQDQTTDGDGSPLVVNNFQQDNGYLHSFNQELRIANATSSAFRWVLGANYERSNTFQRQLLVYSDNSSNAPSKLFLQRNFQQGQQSIRNYAFFGNAEFDLTPDITLKAAARYTDSRNRAAICGYDAGDGNAANFFNFLGTRLGTVPFTRVGSSGSADGNCFSLNGNNVPSGVPYKNTLSEDNVSWRVGLDYRLNPAVLLYANASRGYKAGSYPILAAASISQFMPVTQESVTAFEGGFKVKLWDSRIQINNAAFYYKYKDKQVLTKDRFLVFGVLDILRNIPKSRVLGLESEFTIRPVAGLTMAAAITYLDTKIQRYLGVDYIGTNRNFAGEPLPFAPKWNYSFNVDYRLKTNGGGTPFVGVSVNGHSSSDTVPGGGTIPVTSAPTTRILPGLAFPFRTNSYTTVDGRLGYEAPGGRWRAMVWGKNIFNRYYWTNVVTRADFSSRYAGKPATYGLTIGFNIE